MGWSLWFYSRAAFPVSFLLPLTSRWRWGSPVAHSFHDWAPFQHAFLSMMDFILSNWKPKKLFSSFLTGIRSQAQGRWLTRFFFGMFLWVSTSFCSVHTEPDNEPCPPNVSDLVSLCHLDDSLALKLYVSSSLPNHNCKYMRCFIEDKPLTILTQANKNSPTLSSQPIAWHEIEPHNYLLDSKIIYWISRLVNCSHLLPSLSSSSSQRLGTCSKATTIYGYEPQPVRRAWGSFWGRPLKKKMDGKQQDPDRGMFQVFFWIFSFSLLVSLLSVPWEL